MFSTAIIIRGFLSTSSTY